MRISQFGRLLHLAFCLFAIPHIKGMDNDSYSHNDPLSFKICDDQYLEDIKKASFDHESLQKALRYAAFKGNSNRNIILYLIEGLDISSDTFEYAVSLFTSLCTHSKIECAARLLSKKPELVQYAQDNPYSKIIFDLYRASQSDPTPKQSTYFGILLTCFQQELPFNSQIAIQLLPLLLKDGASDIAHCCDLVELITKKCEDTAVKIPSMDIVPRKYIMYNYISDINPVLGAAGAAYQKKIPQEVLEGFNKVILPLVRNNLLSQNTLIEIFLDFLFTSIPPQTDLPIMRLKNEGIALQEVFVAGCLNTIAPHLHHIAHFSEDQKDTFIRGFYKWIERRSPQASCTVVSLLLLKFPFLATHPHCSWSIQGSSKNPSEPRELPLASVERLYAKSDPKFKNQMVQILQIYASPSSSLSSSSLMQSNPIPLPSISSTTSSFPTPISHIQNPAPIVVGIPPSSQSSTTDQPPKKPIPIIEGTSPLSHSNKSMLYTEGGWTANVSQNGDTHNQTNSSSIQSSITINGQKIETEGPGSVTISVHSTTSSTKIDTISSTSSTVSPTINHSSNTPAPKIAPSQHSSSSTSQDQSDGKKPLPKKIKKAMKKRLAPFENAYRKTGLSKNSTLRTSIRLGTRGYVVISMIAAGIIATIWYSMYKGNSKETSEDDDTGFLKKSPRQKNHTKRTNSVPG